MLRQYISVCTCKTNYTCLRGDWYDRCGKVTRF